MSQQPPLVSLTNASMEHLRDGSDDGEMKLISFSDGSQDDSQPTDERLPQPSSSHETELSLSSIDSGANDSALLTSLTSAEERCMMAAEEDHLDGWWCQRAWDGIHCWPPTVGGSVAEESCTTVLPGPPELQRFPQAVAFRTCNVSGQWHQGSWTNYSQCLDVITLLEQNGGGGGAVVAVRYITFAGSLVSLLMLLVSLFIFMYFRSLECDRLRVHRNLLAALLLQFVAMLVIVEPYVTYRRSPSYNDLDWLCRALLSLKMYGQVASIMWMFVEGLFLHSRLTCNVFDSAAPFKFYYSIGWGIPLMVICSWCTVMQLNHHEHCWRQYSRVPYIWILEAPMLLALLINLLFLINIIRILVTKLRTNDSAETIKIRKAIRATIILFQLLGITNLLVAVNPGPDLEAAYMLTNAILQSSQGIIVSAMYCFLNGEVKEVLRKRWRQYWVRKMAIYRPGTRGGMATRGGSYYQHRKNTFSTIVLPATFTFNRRNSITTNQATTATTNASPFNQSPRPTFDLSKQPSPFRCSTDYRKSTTALHEPCYRSNYCELQRMPSRDSNSRANMKYQSFESCPQYRENSFCLDPAANKQNTKLSISGDGVHQELEEQRSERKNLQNHHHHTMGSTFQGTSKHSHKKCPKPEDVCASTEQCNLDLFNVSCCVQTICSNESCRAEPCSLNSCIFGDPCNGSYCTSSGALCKDSLVQSCQTAAPRGNSCSSLGPAATTSTGGVTASVDVHVESPSSDKKRNSL